MATNLSGVLASVPGLAGYLAKQQLDQQQEMGQVQQLGALAQLQAQMQNQQAQAQNRQRQEAARQALASLGPDATEDQRVNALLPHIGDPDKIAGILQNASLKKAQQEQTKQLAMTRLQQQASQHLDNLAVKIQNAKTAEERSHWEQQVAQAQLGFRQQAADIAAGRFNYETGMTVPSLPRPFIPGAMGASAAPAGPTPQPTPSAAPGPVPAPSEAPGGPVPGPMMDSSGLGKLTPDQLAMGIQEAIVSGGQYPNDPAHKAAYDRFVAEAKRRGMAVNAPFPQAAPSAAVPATTAAPQAAPQPAPAPSPATTPAPSATTPAPRPGNAPFPEGLPDHIKFMPPTKMREQEIVKWAAEKAKRDNKPQLPTPALRMQQEEVDAISTASTINADLGSISNQLSTGKLKLGLLENISGELRNKIGISDEDSRNLASFKATLEKLRNDSLRLNKGVQTEGDAVRAWNELVANINDPGVVKQRLDEIQRINSRAVNIRRLNVDNIRRNFGLGPLDVSEYERQPAAVGAASTGGSGAIREFATEAEAAAAGLAPGTRVKIGGKTGTWK